MDYTVEHRGDERAVISISGRLDAGTTPEFKSRVKQIASERAAFVVIDMEGVSFIDTAGLAGLISGHKAARMRDGMLVLVSVSDEVQAILELLQLNLVFQVFDDVKGALTYLDSVAKT